MKILHFYLNQLNNENKDFVEDEALAVSSFFPLKLNENDPVPADLAPNKLGAGVEVAEPVVVEIALVLVDDGNKSTLFVVNVFKNPDDNDFDVSVVVVAAPNENELVDLGGSSFVGAAGLLNEIVDVVETEDSCTCVFFKTIILF
jgi:hypothetical protein